MHWLDPSYNRIGYPWSKALELNKGKVTDKRAAIEDTKSRLQLLNKIWDSVYNLLRSAGIPYAVLPFATAQALAESNNLRSHVAITDNNYSGIKYKPKNKSQRGATQGLRSPEGDHYAHFNSVADWARDFRRVLSQAYVETAIGPGGPPAIDARDLADYVHRLKVNGYFGASELSYRNLLMSILAAKGNIPALVKKYDDAGKVIDDVVDRVEHPFTYFLPPVPTWVKVTGGIVLGVIVIKAVSK